MSSRPWLTACAILSSLAVFGVPEPVEAACSASPGAGVDWTQCRKSNLMLRGYDLSGSKMRRTDMSRSDLRKSDLSGTDMTRGMLYRANLTGAKLMRMDLSKVQGNRAKMIGADLAGAILVKSEFSRADFTGANLSGADLSKSELGRARFTKAKLEAVKLVFSNIARAKFQKIILLNADLSGAYTFQTRFEGADLSSAAGLTQKQLDIACGDADTKLPAGLSRPAVWPCPEDEE